jgi:hypothetical protein
MRACITMRLATLVALLFCYLNPVESQGVNKYYTGPGNYSGYCPIQSCTASNCQAYQYKSGCTFNTSGVCTNCTGLVAGKYFSSSGTGLTDNCIQSKCTDCQAGFYNSGCSASSAGTCVACSGGLLPANNYWTVPADATAVCPYTAQAVCLAGEKNIGYDSTSSGTCSPCPAPATGFYFTLPTSPTENCATKKQTLCPAGQVNNGYSHVSAGTCQNCVGLINGKYYINNTAPSSNCPTSDCVDTGCATGQYKKGCTGTSSGVCAPCTNANASQVYVSTGSWSNTCLVDGCVKICPSGQYVVGCGLDGIVSSALTCGSCTNAVPNVNYYVRQGGYTPTSCPVSACMVCDNGNYLLGCGGTASGTCTKCTNTVY